jgi:predicted nucleic acid-binding protein
MTYPYIDASVIIRLLTGDDPVKQARSRALFEQIQQGAVSAEAPATIIADAVHVLSSPHLYGLPRDKVAALLSPLIRLPGFQVQGRRAVLAALQLYGATSRLDIGDALIATTMQHTGATIIYSYYGDFDRIDGIARQEP